MGHYVFSYHFFPQLQSTVARSIIYYIMKGRKSSILNLKETMAPLANSRFLNWEKIIFGSQKQPLKKYIPQKNMYEGLVIYSVFSFF